MGPSVWNCIGPGRKSFWIILRNEMPFRQAMLELRRRWKSWKRGQALGLMSWRGFEGVLFRWRFRGGSSPSNAGRFARRCLLSWRRRSIGCLVLPQMTIGAVDGAALGGGANLMHLDRVTLSQDAVFGLFHSSLGVSPGWGGGRRWLKKLGHVWPCK